MAIQCDDKRKHLNQRQSAITEAQEPTMAQEGRWLYLILLSNHGAECCFQDKMAPLWYQKEPAREILCDLPLLIDIEARYLSP